MMKGGSNDGERRRERGRERERELGEKMRKELGLRREGGRERETLNLYIYSLEVKCYMISTITPPTW